MRGWVVGVAVVVAGCSGVKVVPGRQMTQLPQGLVWCGARSQRVERPAEAAPGAFPEEAFRHCSAVLRDEDPSVTDDAWEGSMVFGLTTDDVGRVTEVCLWGANFGDPTRYVSCVADVLRTYQPALPAQLKKARYTVTFIMD